MKISEAVSNGHPDKVADIISSDILDYCLKQDPDTRFAVEVQIKGNVVNLAGEISTKAELTRPILHNCVKNTLTLLGYDEKYCQRWGMPMLAKNLHVNTYITVQSGEISQGLEQGYGDQGIFFGQACKEATYGFFSRDYWLAKTIAAELFQKTKTNIELGLDIKTLVVCDNYDNIKKIIVAVPTHPGKDLLARQKIIEAITPRYTRWEGGPLLDKLIINGTGAYHAHGPMVDCGMTGRKLAVDFYGGNCRVGGGSPWTKDGTKADLSLNLLARFLALKWMLRYHDTDTVNVSIACAIGRPDLEITYTDGTGEILRELSLKIPPQTLIEGFSLKAPIYGELARKGLFTGVDHLAQIATVNLQIPEGLDVGV